MASNRITERRPTRRHTRVSAPAPVDPPVSKDQPAVRQTQFTIVEDAQGNVTLHVLGTFTIQCGRSRFTMTPEGKISQQGVNILSHATNANRIRGNRVDIR